LATEVKRLAAAEGAATVDLVRHLAELDRRRLHLAAGFSSLFGYCTEVLRLSEHAAFHRILAARKSRRFPVILQLLSENALTLTSIRLVAPYLTRENHEELLASACGRSKRELEKLLAARFPRPDVAASIRRLPGNQPTGLPTAPEALAPSAAAAPLRQFDLPPASEHSPTVRHSPATPVVQQRPVVVALAPSRYQITFTASEETREKLQLAQDLLRHTIPHGDPAAIVDRALTALLRDIAREKYAATESPRPGKGTANGSRYIAAEVRRFVWVRDLGRCRFVGTDGRRCNARGFLEFHHLVPYAAGGTGTAENIQLRCRAHNAYEADLYFNPSQREDAVNEPVAAYLLADALQLGPDLVESYALKDRGPMAMFRNASGTYRATTSASFFSASSGWKPNGPRPPL
jgi:hypothetical protein